VQLLHNTGIDAIHAVYDQTKSPKGLGNRWILEGDIKSCFDKISHEWLLQNIPFHKGTFKKWLKSGYVWQNGLFPTDEGTPQGGVISPTLANLALNGFEKVLNDNFVGVAKNPKTPRNTGKAQKYGINYTRYADDFIITAKKREYLEKEVMPLLVQFLSERGLQLSPEKTVITDKLRGFKFLGFWVKTYQNEKVAKRYTLRIKAHPDNIKKVKKKLKDIAQKVYPPEVFVTKMNEVIRGWAEYYKSAYAQITFNEVDQYVHKLTMKYLKRLHPNKSTKWRVNNYMSMEGIKSWTFQVKSTAGKRKSLLTLRRFSETKPGKGNFPKVPKSMDAYLHFDEYAALLKKRFDSGWSPGGFGKINRLMKIQNLTCPVCKQIIDNLDEAEVHHVVPWSRKGTDDLSNLRLLHYNCHKRVHSQPVIHPILTLHPSPFFRQNRLIFSIV
jgi:RNA-directed DNA polymerase